MFGLTKLVSQLAMCLFQKNSCFHKNISQNTEGTRGLFPRRTLVATNMQSPADANQGQASLTTARKAIHHRKKRFFTLRSMEQSVCFVFPLKI